MADDAVEEVWNYGLLPAKGEEGEVCCRGITSFTTMSSLPAPHHFPITFPSVFLHLFPTSFTTVSSLPAPLFLFITVSDYVKSIS